MSLSGLKKQLNKANQLINEKVGGTKGTELDAEYLEMDKDVENCVKLFEEVTHCTHALLQPNPASRALLFTRSTLQRAQGKQVQMAYPQPEAKLAETFQKFAKELTLMPNYAQAMQHSADCFQSLADQKYVLEDQVHQNFIVPIGGFQTRELKEIQHHKKKVQSRRLDFDCKRRQDKSGTESEEVKQAKMKFLESKQLAMSAMSEFFDCEVEFINALKGFIDASMNYHEHALKEMTELKDQVEQLYCSAQTQPKKAVATSSSNSHEAQQQALSSSSLSVNSHQSAAEKTLPALHPNLQPPAPSPGAITSPLPAATCRALFDFNPESTSELGFKEGNIITLLEKLDDNWYMGELNGKTGHFPVTYVEVVQPQP